MFFFLVGRLSRGTAWENDLILLVDAAAHSLGLMEEEVLGLMSLPFSYWMLVNGPQTINKNPILFRSHYFDLGRRDVFEIFIYIFKIIC